MHAWEGRCGILDGNQICSQRSVFRPKGSHHPETPDVERSPVDEAILRALAEFPFPFPFSSVRELSWRICFPRSTVHRAPAPHVITLLHGATSSMGPPRFDSGT
jgi:hypothetical protein